MIFWMYIGKRPLIDYVCIAKWLISKKTHIARIITLLIS